MPEEIEVIIEEDDGEIPKRKKKKENRTQSWSLVFWLCFFGGWFGLHRFYVGRIFTGIIQAITFGGFGIWWIWDLLSIYGSKFTNAQGNVIRGKKPPKRFGYFRKMVILSALVMIIGFIGAFLEGTTPTQTAPSSGQSSGSIITSLSPAAYYAVNNGVRGRSCPRTSCEVVDVLNHAEAVTVVGYTTGASVSGERRWWVTQTSSGQRMFIHRSLLSGTRPQQNTQNQPTGPQFTCNCSKTCSAMTCREAYFQLNQCGCSRRDGDGDGVPCESQCR